MRVECIRLLLKSFLKCLCILGVTGLMACGGSSGGSGSGNGNAVTVIPKDARGEWIYCTGDDSSGYDARYYIFWAPNIVVRGVALNPTCESGGGQSNEDDAEYAPLPSVMTTGGYEAYRALLTYEYPNSTVESDFVYFIDGDALYVGELSDAGWELDFDRPFQKVD